MATRLAMMALLAVRATGMDEEMWGPADGVKAFGAVEKALQKITSIHMSPEQSKRASHVADDVRKAMAIVESKSNLTKAERYAKMGSAIKELSDLEGDYKVVQKVEDKSTKLAKLQKELAEKKEELEKDEASIKLYTLQKELAEKKLMLEKLIEKKTQSQTSKKAEAEDAAQQGALVEKLMNMTSSLAKVAGKKAELPAPLKAALSEVQARSKKEADALEHMDATNKKAMAELDAQLKKTLPTKGKNAALSQGESMIRKLKKEEHRQYMKARAQKQAQVNELKNIQQSIEQHDAKQLQNTLAKMRHEAKAIAAKSGNFLH